MHRSTIDRGDNDIVHTHKGARACLGIDSAVRDFRRYERAGLHHGSFLADEAWDQRGNPTCLGFQSEVRDFRRYEPAGLHHGSFLADEAWGQRGNPTCLGFQSEVRDFRRGLGAVEYGG